MKATAAKNEETIGIRLIEGEENKFRKKTRDTFKSSLLMMAATARATCKLITVTMERRRGERGKKEKDECIKYSS